jgi:8-oxo-dGTP diphosphatase
MARAVAVGLVVRGDEVLMVRRKRKEGRLRWNFPGGRVERSETPQQAVQREILEETGIVCRVDRELGVRQHPDTGAGITYWRCTYITGEVRVKEAHKMDRARWVKAAAVESLVTTSLAAVVRKELHSIIDAASDPSVTDTSVGAIDDAGPG